MQRCGRGADATSGAPHGTAPLGPRPGDLEYVLGGGAQESLLHFKAGFTKEHRSETTARIIVDPAQYAALCEQWSSRSGRGAGGAAEFFPASRAPLGAAV